MSDIFRTETTVLPGHRVEFVAPEIPEGAQVEVIVNYSATTTGTRVSMLEFLSKLPPGPVLFETPEEANRHLQQERDSWE